MESKPGLYALFLKLVYFTLLPDVTMFLCVCVCLFLSRSSFTVTPGSEQIRATMERDQLVSKIEIRCEQCLDNSVPSTEINLQNLRSYMYM